MSGGSHPSLDLAVEEAAALGQTVSGDRWVMVSRRAGLCVAVIDGLGHGEGANLASEAVAGALLATSALDADVATLFQLAHKAARSTRGVVMSAALISTDRDELWWAGIGNVEGALLPAQASGRARHRMLLHGGIVGYRMPTLRPQRHAIAGNDLLVMATDGIGHDFLDQPILRQADSLSVAQIAAEIFRVCRNPGDDALLLVARYRCKEAAHDRAQ